MNRPLENPYTNCEAGQCNHELAQAVTLSELLTDNDPLDTSQMLVKLRIDRRGSSMTSRCSKSLGGPQAVES